MLFILFYVLSFFTPWRIKYMPVENTDIIKNKWNMQNTIK